MDQTSDPISGLSSIQSVKRGPLSPWSFNTGWVPNGQCVRNDAKKPPQEERMEERVKAAQFIDPASEMIWRRRWELEEKCKAMPLKFGRRGINRRKKMV